MSYIVEIKGNEEELVFKKMVTEKQLNATPNLSKIVPISANVEMYCGDITALTNMDVIVNAANEFLQGCQIPGHCVDSAICTAAGKELLDYLHKTYPRGAATGEVVSSPGFHSNAKYILHAVAPRAGLSALNYTAVPHAHALAKCYLQSLKFCEEKKLESIAFCCLGTGIFGYPKEEACQVALYAIYRHFLSSPKHPKTVILSLFDKENQNIYPKYFSKFFLFRPSISFIFRLGMMGDGIRIHNADCEKLTLADIRQQYCTRSKENRNIFRGRFSIGLLRKVGKNSKSQYLGHFLGRS